MRVAAAIANHLLRDDTWARSRLVAHHGKSLRLALPPFSVALRIGMDGAFEALTETPATFDLEFTLPASALPLALSGRDALERAADLRGDTELAQTLRELADAAPWFLERELAHWTGPIVAQRLADLARGLASWPAYAAEHFSANIAAYLVEEQPALVKRARLDEFTQAVTTLRDDVARLEQRIEQAGAIRPR
jgi:ubiquinone biosynthesis protein UbiJ